MLCVKVTQMIFFSWFDIECHGFHGGQLEEEPVENNLWFLFVQFSHCLQWTGCDAPARNSVSNKQALRLIQQRWGYAVCWVGGQDVCIASSLPSPT